MPQAGFRRAFRPGRPGSRRSHVRRALGGWIGSSPHRPPQARRSDPCAHSSEIPIPAETGRSPSRQTSHAYVEAMTGEEVSEADPQQTVEGWQRAPIERHPAKESSRPETRPLCVKEPRTLVHARGSRARASTRKGTKCPRRREVAGDQRATWWGGRSDVVAVPQVSVRIRDAEEEEPPPATKSGFAVLEEAGEMHAKCSRTWNAHTASTAGLPCRTYSLRERHSVGMPRALASWQATGFVSSPTASIPAARHRSTNAPAPGPHFEEPSTQTHVPATRGSAPSRG